jgi:glutathione reductase (NADPH)
MDDYDYDLFVIGGGSAGVRCARIAASLGAKVALCEDRDMGGTCVHRGCVPKKLMATSASLSGVFADAQGLGWSVSSGFDWSTMTDNIQRELTRLRGIYERLLDNAGVTRVTGRGRLIAPHTVEVAGQRITAERVVVACGGLPYRPDAIQGGDLALSSDDLFTLPEQPRRVVIVGGGYIATEFASIFSGLGSEVHLVVRGDTILRGFEQDLATHLQSALAERGIHLHMGREVSTISTHDGAARRVSLDNGHVLDVDQVVLATGRRPNTAGLGLTELGVALTPTGGVVVDEHYASTLPWLYALGDLIERVQLTPVALCEGMYLAHHLYGTPRPPVPYRLVPTAVFTTPPAATVGLTETEAHAQGHEVQIFRSAFRPLANTIAGRDERTLMKLIVDAQTDRVLGAHMVGPDAPEIMQGFAVAMTCGATKAQLDATIGIHPSAAEEFVTMRTPVQP